jgi:hypothetical protein
MKKLNPLLFLITILVSSLSVKAQQKDTVKSTWVIHGHDIAGAVQVQLTYRKANISELNQAFAVNNFPAISPSDLWINLSTNHVSKNWVTEGGIGFSPVARASQNNVDAKYNQYQLFFKAGYNLKQSTDFRLYPFVGLNLSAAVLNIEDHNAIQSVSSFSDELFHSTASKTFYQPNFGVELGAGFDYLIKLKPKQMECFTIERNIPIGIRAGYYINTYASNWKVYSYSPPVGNTDQKQSAVFLTFNIGLGYAVKK